MLILHLNLGLLILIQWVESVLLLASHPPIFFEVLAAGTSSSSLSRNSTIFGPDSAFFAFPF